MSKQKPKQKPLHPENCERNLSEAMRLLKLYSKGSFDVYALSESKFTAQRADIMRGYCGREIPFGQCTAGAMLDTFCEHAKDSGANPPIESNDQLIRWFKSIDGQEQPEPPSEPTAAEKLSEIMAEDHGKEPAETIRFPGSQTSNGENQMAKKKAIAKKPKSAKKAANKPAKKPAAKNPAANKEPAKKPASSKKPAAPKAHKEPKADGKLTLLDAAAQVLEKSKEPLGIRGMVEKILEAKLWEGNAKQPHQSLSGAVQREIKAKGKESRFKKVGRGLFEFVA